MTQTATTALDAQRIKGVLKRLQEHDRDGADHDILDACYDVITGIWQANGHLLAYPVPCPHCEGREYATEPGQQVRAFCSVCLHNGAVTLGRAIEIRPALARAAEYQRAKREGRKPRGSRSPSGWLADCESQHTVKPEPSP